MRDDVIETIRETLSIKKGGISPNTPIATLVKDSIDMVELMVVLSDRYQVAIDTEDLQTIKTVGDIQRYVAAHGGQRPAGRPGPF